MKQTIQNTVLGGLASLILGSGLALADDTKKPQPEAVKEEVHSKEAMDEVLQQVKKLGLDKKLQIQIEKALKSKQQAQAGIPQIMTKTFVMGPDGKMTEIAPKKGATLNLDSLLDELNQEEMNKHLKTQDVTVTGKMVVVDEEGNVIEKELEAGQNLNDLIKEALEGKDLGAIDLRNVMGKARVLGVGHPAVLNRNHDNPEFQALKADLKKVREEMKAQRKLLEKILKKLD